MILQHTGRRDQNHSLQMGFSLMLPSVPLWDRYVFPFWDRYARPFWDHCALPLGDEYMRDAEEISRLQNGQDQRNHENTRRTLNIRDMWAGTDFSACFWNGKKARQELQEIPEGLIQEMLHEMLDAVPAKQNCHCTLPLVFFYPLRGLGRKGQVKPHQQEQK